MKEKNLLEKIEEKWSVILLIIIVLIAILLFALFGQKGTPVPLPPQPPG